MGKFVLVVFFTLFDFPSAPAYYFETREACEAAAGEFRQYAEARKLKPKFFLVKCFSTGTRP